MAESQPLLSEESRHTSVSPPPDYTVEDTNKPVAQVVGDELPPPYAPINPNSATGYSPIASINCKVCQTQISLDGRHHLHVVKCPACHEATPIKNAPPGKKYIRCPCNCLLMCNVRATRVACPRENCRRYIALAPPSVHFASSPGTALGRGVRARCGHCSHIFVFLKQHVVHRLAICPECGRRSCVGNGFIKRKVLLFGIIGVVFLLIGLITTIVAVETYDSAGVYVVWIGAYIIGLLNILRAGIYCCTKVSPLIESNNPGN